MKLISIIDPGHRRDTPGKSGNGVKEYEFNESVARLLGAALSKYGEVYYTIETENHLYSEMTAAGRIQNLNYRTSRANNIYWEAVKKYGKGNFKIVFISIHANAYSNPNVSGYEVFVYKHGSEAHQLVKAIHRQAQLILGVGTDINDRGIKEANFAVLKNTIMPAVLIEHEFYTNSIGTKKLLDPGFREKCSEHIVKGILDYSGITPTKEVEKIIYRVRKEWENSGSQKGAYSVLENAIDEAKKYEEYKVYDDKGKQVYPESKDDTDHWAYKHYQNLKNKGFDIQKMRFDDNITRGEMFKLLDELTDNNSAQNDVEEFPMKEGDMAMQYNRLLRQGMKGIDVKALQESLTRLGYDTNGVDGIFGSGTNNAVKQFQRTNGLKVDGIVGPATIAKINEVFIGNQSTKSKYYKKGNAHVIETVADNIEIKILGNTLHNTGVFGVNGTFFDTPKPGLAKSCWGIATNEGKAIGGNSMLVSYNRNIKRGTIVCYEDGTVEVLRVNSINEFKKLHKWAISGYSVYPYMHFKSEKMPGGIDYKTAHTYIGHKGNKIYLIVKPYHRIKEIIPLVKELRLDGCIVLDGGGSSQLRHPGGSFKASRKINSAVLLKEE